MRDPHFVERGLFAHQVASATGKTIAGVAAADRAAIPRKPARQKSAAARTRVALPAHQSRLRRGGATPSRITARRNGPMRSIM